MMDLVIMIDRLSQLYAERGSEQYGEDVTQLDHALQSASFAESEGMPDSLVVAALLHDVGHLLHADPGAAAAAHTDGRHETIAAKWLARCFPLQVTEPIRLHVAAKRYLVAQDGRYWHGLSDASRQSLEVQGGGFGEREASAFIGLPFAYEALRLRRWDDMAKIVGATTSSWDHFTRAIERVLAENRRAA